MVHARLKHIEWDYHFAWEKVDDGMLVNKDIPQQLADTLPKLFSKPSFTYLVFMIVPTFARKGVVHTIFCTANLIFLNKI